MTNQLRAASLLLLAGGTILVLALWLDWWGLPPAFDHPADLPRQAETTATFVNRSGQGLEADAFQFYSVRDIVWLGAGIAGFALGWLVVTVPRVSVVAVAAVGLFALAAAILIALTLISPPDYADVAAQEGVQVDFGIDLPLGRDAGGFIALGGALGIVVGAGLVFIGGESRIRNRSG